MKALVNIYTNEVVATGEIEHNGSNYMKKDGTVTRYYSNEFVLVEMNDSIKETDVSKLQYKDNEVRLRKKYSKKQFILLFQPAEWRKFKRLCESDEIAEQYYDAMMSAEYVDLEDEDVRKGFEYMTAKEVLTAERKNEILGG